MKILLTAILLVPCNSAIQTEPALHTTIAHSCPDTFYLQWAEKPESPADYARRQHYWSLPRDDRPPIVEAQATNKASVNKKAKRKTYKKRRRRRH